MNRILMKDSSFINLTYLGNPVILNGQERQSVAVFRGSPEATKSGCIKVSKNEQSLVVPVGMQQKFSFILDICLLVYRV